MTIRKIILKNEESMLKHKILHLFFLNLFFLINNMMGVENTSAYDDYVYPIVSYTHKINRCFLNASLLIKDSPESLRTARQEINKCHGYINELERVIKNCTQLQKKRLVSIFETIAKHSPDKTKNIIIKYIIPQLSLNIMNDIVNLVILPLSGIRNQLDKLYSPTNTPLEFQTGLSNIIAQYESTFSNFISTSNRPMYGRPKGMVSTASNFIFNDILSAPHQKIEILLSEKKDIEKKLNITPEPSKSPKKTIATISRIAKILSSVPFLERLCCWILNNYNEMVKRLIGPRRYDAIKNDTIFCSIRTLHERKIINAANIHNFLKDPRVNATIDFLCNSKEKRPFVDYCNNLQKYFCIELLECLHRSHCQSRAMLQRENQHFSFVYEHAANDNIKDMKLQQNETKKEALWTLANITSITSQAFNRVASFDKKEFVNGIKNTATTTVEVAKLFVSSLSPWYQPPTNIIPQTTNPQPQVLITKQTGDIKSFLLEINRDNKGKQPIDSVDARPKINEKHKLLLQNMIKEHKRLEQDCCCKYQEHTLTNGLNNISSESVSSEIDTLHQSLLKLNEERKNLWFFNVWSKTVNWQERNKITNALKHHIDVYNTAKIDLYNKGESYATTYIEHSVPKEESPYTNLRKKFLANFPFSPKDKTDIFALSQENDQLKDCRYIFNPLERSEMSRSRLNIQ